jgi:hypothetical protein
LGECNFKGRTSQNAVLYYVSQLLYILSVPKQKVASLTDHQEVPRRQGTNYDNEPNDDNHLTLPVHLSADNRFCLDLVHHHGMIGLPQARIVRVGGGNRQIPAL